MFRRRDELVGSRFQFVDDHRNTYEEKRLCQVLGVNDRPPRQLVFDSDFPIPDEPLPRFLDDAAAGRPITGIACVPLPRRPWVWPDAGWRLLRGPLVSTVDARARGRQAAVIDFAAIAPRKS
ncbi:hypothetical protein [Streptomyces sp. NBC_01589]|uniref:hypothetical protein n=1 Tax=unclassified Streptomyces TaxID=2593676 RepID=UPI00386D2CF5